MRRSLIIAAIAFALAALSGNTPALAKSGVHPTDDKAICHLLELAHESTCEEFEEIQLKLNAASMPAVSPETTGSIAPRRFSSDPENFEPQALPDLR